MILQRIKKLRAWLEHDLKNLKYLYSKSWNTLETKTCFKTIQKQELKLLENKFAPTKGIISRIKISRNRWPRNSEKLISFHLHRIWVTLNMATEWERSMLVLFKRRIITSNCSFLSTFLLSIQKIYWKL